MLLVDLVEERIVISDLVLLVVSFDELLVVIDGFENWLKLVDGELVVSVSGEELVEVESSPSSSPRFSLLISGQSSAIMESIGRTFIHA